MSRNSVFEELRVRRLADIQEENSCREFCKREMCRPRCQHQRDRKRKSTQFVGNLFMNHDWLKWTGSASNPHRRRLRVPIFCHITALHSRSVSVTVWNIVRRCVCLYITDGIYWRFSLGKRALGRLIPSVVKKFNTQFQLNEVNKSLHLPTCRPICLHIYSRTGSRN